MAASIPHSPRVPIVRSTNYVLWGLAATAMAVAFIPWVGAFLSHGVDRVKNHWEAKDEIKLRADYYRNIVAARLGKNPAKVTVDDFQLIAKSDPTFSKVVKDVENKESNANRESALMNTGVFAAGLVGLGGFAHMGAGALKAAEIGKTIVGGMAGSALSSFFDKNTVSVQDVIERMHSCLLDAQDRGMDPRGAVTPQLVFLLRVAQDPAFAEQIKQSMGGGKLGFQQMSVEQQLQVMQSFPALANAAQSEAYAVSAGILPVQELAARAPNLNSKAAAYAIGEQNASFSAAPKSFADRVNASRAASPAQAGYMAAVDAERAAAAQKTTTVTS